MKTIGPALAAALSLSCLLAPTAGAQRRDEPVGRVGNVSILRVWEGGRFDRCFGLVPGVGGGARIFWNVGRDYILTVPAVGTGRSVNIALSTPRGMIHAAGPLIGDRAVITLNGRQAQQVMSLRGRVEVDVQGTIFPYALQGATMEEVFVAVENCAHRNNR